MTYVTKLTIRRMGGGLGVVIPSEVAHKLKISHGDNVDFTEAMGGGWRMTRHNPDFERQMALVAKITSDDANILRELAK